MVRILKKCGKFEVGDVVTLSFTGSEETFVKLGLAEVYEERKVDKFLDVGLKRSPVKKRRAKPRRGPMRDAKYRKWLSIRNCVACQRTSMHYCEPAHTENNGMSSKGPDSSCAPLCAKHHSEYDAGREAFEKKYRVDMQKIAAEHYARYKAEE